VRGSGSGASESVELREKAGSAQDRSGARFGRGGAWGGARFWDAPARSVRFPSRSRAYRTRSRPPGTALPDSRRRSEQERPRTALPPTLRPSRTVLPTCLGRSLPFPEAPHSCSPPVRFTSRSRAYRTRSRPPRTALLELSQTHAGAPRFLARKSVYFLIFWLCGWALGHFWG
jgi:hypothetical protein